MPSALFGHSYVTEITNSYDFYQEVLCQSYSNGTSSGNLDSSYDNAVPQCRQLIRFVMFYATWCTACHRFSLVWIRLAEHFSNSKSVQFFSFNCAANNDSFQLCLIFNVAVLPTLYMIISEENGNVKPAIQPKISPGDRNLAYGIPVLSMDYADTVLWMERQLGVTAENAMIYMTNLCTNDNLIDILETKVMKMREFQLERWIESAELLPDLAFHDALLGLQFMLRNWVSYERLPGSTFTSSVGHELHNYLIDEQVDCIIDLISLAKKLFPGANIKCSFDKLQNFLYNHKNPWMNENNDDNSRVMKKYFINELAWHNFFDNWELAGLKSSPLGEFPQFQMCRTLLCSIWMLLHMLTIGSDFHAYAIMKDSSKLSNDDVRALESPYRVLVIIRNVLYYFLGCADCRNHFIYIYEHCSYDHCLLVPDVPSIIALTRKPFIPLNRDNMNIVSNANATYSAGDAVQIKTDYFSFSNGYEILVFWLWNFHNAVTFRTAVQDTQGFLDALCRNINENTQENNQNTMPNIFDRISLIIRRLLSSGYKSYFGTDPRWPTAKSCRRCRREGMESATINRYVMNRWVNKAEVDDEIFNVWKDYFWPEVYEYLKMSYWNNSWGISDNNVLIFNKELKIFVVSEK